MKRTRLLAILLIIQAMGCGPDGGQPDGVGEGVAPVGKTDIALYRLDDRDLTLWLFGEIDQALRDSDVNAIRSLLNSGSTASLTLSLVMWRALVRDRARYDFKHRIAEEMGEVVFYQTLDRRLLPFQHRVAGNVFFGFVGAYIGFPRALLHAGAGYAEIVDPAHGDERNLGDFGYLPWENLASFGDEPAGKRTVAFGYDLWEAHGAELSLADLMRAIEASSDQLMPPTGTPGEGTVPAVGWRNPLGGWPYGVGRFNGPREHEFWPLRSENGYGLR